jgi:hypothetical protein
VLVPNAISWGAMWLSSLVLAAGLWHKEAVRRELLRQGNVWTNNEAVARRMFTGGSTRWRWRWRGGPRVCRAAGVEPGDAAGGGWVLDDPSPVLRRPAGLQAGLLGQGGRLAPGNAAARPQLAAGPHGPALLCLPDPAPAPAPCCRADREAAQHKIDQLSETQIERLVEEMMAGKSKPGQLMKVDL